MPSRNFLVAAGEDDVAGLLGAEQAEARFRPGTSGWRRIRCFPAAFGPTIATRDARVKGVSVFLARVLKPVDGALMSMALGDRFQRSSRAATGVGKAFATRDDKAGTVSRGRACFRQLALPPPAGSSARRSERYIRRNGQESRAAEMKRPMEPPGAGQAAAAKPARLAVRTINQTPIRPPGRELQARRLQFGFRPCYRWQRCCGNGPTARSLGQSSAQLKTAEITLGAASASARQRSHQCELVRLTTGPAHRRHDAGARRSGMTRNRARTSVCGSWQAWFGYDRGKCGREQKKPPIT